jgi:hypothetical protein
MKIFTSTIKVLVVLGIAVLFVGVSPVSATRAVTDKGTGCYVRVGTGDDDYVFDSACRASDVLKFDDEENFEFYIYQDHGQLPENTWRPERVHHSTFEACYLVSFGVICGTVKETVTPSGEYKSSFKATELAADPTSQQ